MIYKKKKSTKAEDLCAGFHPNLPRYIDYCKKLRFDEEPDYDHLINLLLDSLEYNKFKIDFDYDWNKEKNYMNMSTKTADSNNNLEQSFNTNIRNRNSNSNYSSVINKNDIAQDLKIIVVEDNNSIKQFKEKEKNNKDNLGKLNKGDEKKNDVEVKGKIENDQKNKNVGNGENTEKGKIAENLGKTKINDTAKEKETIVKKASDDSMCRIF